IQGLVTFAQCHPDRPLLAGVVARMMSALRA
ncbi:TetR/AcrR family transcriptional regulator, partial [Aeromonas caviae]|nr:TetR/AcrR family transcriptional regulator [Aeromonas caviae]